MLVSLPLAYVFGVRQKSLVGLWVGYGTSALLLGCIYSFVLLRTNWKQVAEQAAKDEIESKNSSAIEESKIEKGD